MDNQDQVLDIQKGVLLANQTTFKIGGPARYFITAKSEKDLIRAIKFARRKLLPYFILGGGSNLLVSDEGFNGVVIKIQDTRYEIRDTKIINSAGVRLSGLVKASVGAGLTGLEWAVGIPGTIGGAIRGNAGAFDHSISESVKEVKTLNNALQITHYSLHDLNFSYRDSIFKKNNDIIISAALQLKKGEQEESRKMLKDYLKQKKEKQLTNYPSAGCVFKNPLFLWRRTGDISLNFRGLSPVPAGYLIDQCGLKGKKIGQAAISEKHANFIVNCGGARAKDAVKLIQLIKKTVQKKFKIKLEEEIEYLGFD